MILTVAQIEGFVSVQFQMVEKLKDLCLKQREEIKSLKSSILFPDAMNSHLQGLAEKQGSELIEAKQLIPSLQRQVSSLTGQLKCLAEDLAEVRTIFIFGLPEDVKERELQNLLRWLPGYEASQVNFKGEHPMGFALFATQQHALAAKDALQDMVFDADSKSVLHIEMAKKNLFVKRGIVADSNVYDQSKRMRTASELRVMQLQASTYLH